MKQITKSYLEYLGVTEVTTDGKVFTKNGELKTYLMGRSKSKNQALSKNRLTVYLHDPEKYKSVPKEKRDSNSGRVIIKVHQAVYGWFNSEVPYGMEIHHKDFNYLNNSIDNLEALTHEEHLAKHNKGMKELKCRLDIPRNWYEDKLTELEAIENKTKVNYDKISVYRAKLRYYDAHIDEANDLAEFKKDLMELASWKKVFKENNNKKLWHQCCTIEKIVKEKGIEARPVVQHALEVIHKTFGRG